MNDIVSKEYWPKQWPDWPEDPKARKAVASLYELGLMVLNAPASRRKSRLEKAEERARSYRSQMTESEREQVDGLVDLWERNALIQQNIRYVENEKGVDAVEPLLPEWYSSGDQMSKAEKGVLRLGLAANEYFGSCMERFYIIVREERDEFGHYHNLPDHSDLWKQWYAREPITEPLTWPWEHMLTLCKRFEPGSYGDKKRSTGLRLAIAGIVLTIVGIVITIVFGVDGIAEAVIGAILDIF